MTKMTQEEWNRQIEVYERLKEEEEARKSYPTEEQIKEALEAHAKGPEFLKAVLRKREAEVEARRKEELSLRQAKGEYLHKKLREATQKLEEEEKQKSKE